MGVEKDQIHFLPMRGQANLCTYHLRRLQGSSLLKENSGFFYGRKEERAFDTEDLLVWESSSREHNEEFVDGEGD